VVAYVPFGDPVTAGDGILDAYLGAGVDVLEVGIPTREPWLDGPEVAGSMARALDAGVDPFLAADRLGRWREGLAGPSPAIVWFSYPELPLAAIERAADRGAIDGLLMLEPWRHPEAAVLPARLAALAVARCAFLSWVPGERELAEASGATGYVMVQARPGPTGADREPEAPSRDVALARAVAPGLPVVAGFGIHDPAGVRRVRAAGVDGVVVGSACVRAIREGGADGLRALLVPIVRAAREPAAA
jgi:tryptophan synthase alpha chain